MRPLTGKDPHKRNRSTPSNNVLHDRAAFTDDESHKRHYYRARYFDRLAGTAIADSYTL